MHYRCTRYRDVLCYQALSLHKVQRCSMLPGIIVHCTRYRDVLCYQALSLHKVQRCSMLPGIIVAQGTEMFYVTRHIVAQGTEMFYVTRSQRRMPVMTTTRTKTWMIQWYVHRHMGGGKQNTAFCLRKRGSSNEMGRHMAGNLL